MASNKYILMSGLISLLSSAAIAQQNDAGYDWRDSSKIATKNLPQHSEFLNNQYPYPAKPRDMWELGIHGGLSLRKSLGHTFSARVDYTGSFNYGMDYRPHTPSQIPGNAANDPWVRNY